MITTQSQLHIAIQLADEFRTQGLIHIEVPKNIAGNSGDGRVVADDFSFPLRVDEIPPRLDFIRLRLLAVCGDVKAAMPLKDKRVTRFRIDKPMLAFEPFRLVFHLGQDKGGRHGSQSFRRIQNRNMSPLSGDIEIGLIFSRSSLGHQSRGKRGAAWPVYLVEPDLGKSFLKLADGEPGIIDDIDGDLALRLRRLQRFVPLALPRLCRSASLARNSEKQADGQTNKE